MIRMTDMLVDKSSVDDKPIADISEIVLVAAQGFDHHCPGDDTFVASAMHSINPTQGA